MLLFSSNINAQAVVKFSEDFESIPIDFASSGSAAWDTTNSLQYSGQNSIHSKIVVAGDSAILTSDAIDITGYSNISLTFHQICKVSYFNGGYIEVSTDNGQTWTQLTGDEYRGNGFFSTNGNKFSATSYSDWLPSDQLATPTNTWWKNETFNLNTFTGNYNSFKVRFSLLDTASFGGYFNYGWLIDDVKLTVSNDELDPPSITLQNPILTDTIYGTGPFNINAELFDSSGIYAAKVIYTINGVTDSINMTNTSGDMYLGTIPSQIYGTTVYYYILAIDNSVNNNTTIFPNASGLNFTNKEKDIKINIGTSGTTTEYSPIYNGTISSLNNYSDHVSLITASEMGNSYGNISSISFFKTNSTSYLNNDAHVQIYIKSTNDTYCPSDSLEYHSELAGATLVYSDTTFGVSSQMGYVDFNFDSNQFFYNGVSNIMVFVRWYRPSALTSDYIKWNYSFSPNKALTLIGENSNPNASSQSDLRPNMLIKLEHKHFDYDVALDTIASPQKVIVISQPIPINVRIRNGGDIALTKTTINWELDSVSQTPYVWNGSLDYGIVSSEINISTNSFTSGSHLLKIWASSPNDNIDAVPINDTIQMSIYGCVSKLSGTYTLGGVNANYSNFSEFFEDLNNCGLSGPTTIKINPGIYNDILYFSNIPGLDSINTLTFESSTNNAPDVIIERELQSNSIVELNNSSYITFKNITIKGTGQSNGNGILITNRTHNITIDNCNIYFENTTAQAFPIYSTERADNISIINNTIRGGKYSIFFKINQLLSENLLISKNNLKEFNIKSIYINNAKSPTISYNKIVGSYIPGTQNQTSISLNKCNEFNIVGNELILSNDGPIYGIYVTSSSGTPSNSSKIYNNISISKGNSTSPSFRALYVEYSSNIEITNNTLVSYSGASNSSVLYVSNTVSYTNISIKNNIIANIGGALTLQTSSSGSSSISSLDYNSYYTSGSTIIKWGATSVAKSSGITGIRNATNMDVNSKIAEPKLYSIDNGRSYSSDLQSAATPISYITHDIDMNQRNSTTPSIGAYEFKVVPIDAGVIDIIDPIAVDTQARVLNIRALVRNFGSDTLFSIPIKYSLNGNTPVNYTWSGTLLPAQLDTISIASITLPVLNYSLEVYTAISADTLNSNDTAKFDYYASPLVDVAVIDLNQPLDGCDKTDTEYVEITIQNKGVTDIASGIIVSYHIEGSSTTVVDTITQTLAVGATLTHQFGQTIDMTSTAIDSIYSFELTVNHISDAISINNTINRQVTSLGLLQAPSVTDVTINYARSTTLTAYSPYTIEWYENDTTSNILTVDTTYTTPILFDTTTYWVKNNTNISSKTAIAGLGNSTYGMWSPNIYGYGTKSKHQILYRASELTALGLTSGDIESIAFQIYGSINNLSGFEIKMANVAINSLTTTYLTNTLTSVYSGSVPASSAGWVTHTLATPFHWDGTSNLLVEIYVVGGRFGFSAPMYYTNTSYNSITSKGGRFVSSSDLAGDVSNGNRPNTKFVTQAHLGCSSLRVPLNVNVPPPAFDGNMAELISPTDGCGLSSATVSVNIVNMGIDTLYGGYGVIYKIDNGAFISPETVNSNIGPKDTLNFTFATLANLSSGSNGTNYTITAAISNPLDTTYSANDTLVVDSIKSFYTPTTPIVSGLTVPYSTQASIIGTSTDSLFWFTDSVLTQLEGIGNPYLTPSLYSDIDYWVNSRKYIPDSIYQIGTSSSISGINGPSPYGSNSKGARHQFLIKASELSAMGLMQGYIKNVSFEAAYVKAKLLKDYTIKIGHTHYSDLNQTYFDSTLTTVFGPVDYIESYLWNTHTFNTPFYWDGESNIIIETCFKGDDMLSYVGVKQSTTPFVSTAQSHGSVFFDCNSNIISNTFSVRPNIRFLQESFGKCVSDSVHIEVNITPAPSKDAALISIIEPVDSASSTTASAVKVILRNYGLSNISSATINWSENNQLQTSYSWTGNLAQGESDTLTITNAHTFMGGYTQIKAWVDLSNDTISTNDTTTSYIIVPLNGTYSIGVNANSNYQSIASAINDLDLCGISGSVIFNIDSGYYSEQNIIKKIKGNNASNPITFQATDLDSTSVDINYVVSTSYNYVFLLKGAEYINFKKLKITAIGTNNGNVIKLIDGANNIHIDNCILTSSSSTSNTAKASCVFAENEDVNGIYINNNILNNGYKGIFFKHNNAGHIYNIEITNNTFRDYVGYGIYITKADSLIITANNMEDLGNNLSVYGIYGFQTNIYDISNNNIVSNPSASSYGINIKGGGDAINRSLISNNMISSINGNGYKIGINLSSANYVDIAYNSINIPVGQADQTQAIKLGSDNHIKLLNNNIYSVGYALFVNNINGIEICDNNNYFTDTSNVEFVYWGSSNMTDLASLQAYTPTENINSLNIEPSFISISDLHSNGIPLYNTGTPFTRVTTDIDGESRSSTSPSIGADEFTPPAIDLGSMSLIKPINTSCDFTVNDTIEVNITNYGLNDIDFSSTPATIVIEISGPTADTLSYTINSGLVNSGDNIDVVVNTNFDLTLSGEYVFNGHISINGDGNTQNDDMLETMVISYPTINTFPFIEDFESGKDLSFRHNSSVESNVSITSYAASNSSSFGLHFEGGLFNDWPSNPTSVEQAFAITEHSSQAYSCNIDASSISSLSLKFDLKQTSNSGLSLGYSSWFRVLLTDVNGVHYLKNAAGDSVFQPQTIYFDPFTTQVFNLDNYTGQTFSISFEAVNRLKYGEGDADGDNVLIDNIVLWRPSITDLAIIEIIQDNSFNIEGAPTTVKVKIDNFGIDTLNNIPLSYQVNSGALVLDTFFGTLAPQEQHIFAFSQTFNLIAGNSNVCVIGNYPNDSVFTNDTACAIFKGLHNFYPNFSDDFEGPDEWFAMGTHDQWELGTPTTTSINSAHSGVNAWVTKLNGNYQSSSTEYLYSPYFTILSYTDSIVIEFWQYMRATPNNAFGNLEYSFDGVIWATVGYSGYAGSQNWYNINVNGQHKWNMLNSSWIKSSIKLDPTVFNTGNKVQFRFKFESLSMITTDEGWAIDDFKLFFPPLNYDAGVTEITLPSDSIALGSTQNVKVTIKNFGYDTLTSIPVSLNVNGASSIIETYTGVLLPDSSVEFIFNATFDVNLNTSSICVNTDLSNDMQHINDTLCKNLLVLPADIDAGISVIETPSGNTFIGQQTEVKVKITNFGNNPISNVNVEYRVAGFIKAQEVYSNTIAPFDTVVYTFNTKYEPPIGNYGLCVSTKLTGDMYSDNDSLCAYLSGVVGIEDANETEFSVYQNQPNPAKNNTNIDFYLPKSGRVQYQLTNLIGEVLISSETVMNRGRNTWKINTSDFKAGVYYYTVSFDNSSIGYKLIIIK